MKTRFVSAIVFGLALTVAASAQDTPATAPAGQAPAPPATQPAGPGGRQGLPMRAGVTGRMAETGMGGRGATGIVLEAAASHFIIKTDAGATYTVFFGDTTRVMKQMVQRRGPGAGGRNAPGGGNPPESLKPSDIKVGDSIAALGDLDIAKRTLNAMVIALIDPERAKLMHEQQANYGKTWIQGKVTAINETKVSLLGTAENDIQAFVADENTTFRKRREPITLADLQVGDIVRVDGAVKDGSFLATAVTVMGMPPGGTPTFPSGATPVPDSK